MNASVRKFMFWHLPIGSALAGATLFGYGFYAGVTETAGVRVGQLPSNHPLQVRQKAEERLRIVLLGDSLARGIGDQRGLGIGGSIEQELAKRGRAFGPTVNLAISGSRTADLLRQLESRSVRTLIAEANVVVISIGGNDLFGSAVAAREGPPENVEKVMDEVRRRAVSIVRTVREANPSARIFLIGLYNPFSMTATGAPVDPLVNRWNASLVSAFATDRRVTVVQTADLFTHHDRLSADRFHPGAEAYEIIGRRISESL